MKMSEEYYIVVDEVKEDVHVCMYHFDDDHPSGFERKVFTRNYSKGSAFSFDDAKGFCDRLCDIFNSEAFEKESVNFVKLNNN